MIPIRVLETTKLRLANVLTESQRASLTLSLLSKLLRSIESSRIDQVIVVTPEAERIRLKCRGISKLELIPEKKYHSGVNAAMEDGILHASSQNEVRDIYLMPSDLPLADPKALDKMLELKNRHDLIIAPSRKRDGTNLLASSIKRRIPMHYDDNSFHKHVAEANSSRLDYLLLDQLEFSFDVDDKSDLEELMHIYNAHSFEELLDILGR